ncbi:MAG: hypothetical protein ACI94Y_002811 [Maribacter sp.]|jgi:hypothetical protein
MKLSKRNTAKASFILFRVLSIVGALRTASSRVIFGSFFYKKEQEPASKALKYND